VENALPAHLPDALRQRLRTPAWPGELGRLWQRLRGYCFDRYRPERHYMRGPGPRWHQKHSA
jgi:hypothetical protein